jgi:glycosyltransferase involved in cell wall biosynthesis
MTTRSDVRISVVVPTRDRARALPRCLSALVDQDLDSVEFEIIVVDDGSQDDTRAVVANFQREDDRVTYVNRGHGGVNRARNLGVEVSRGTYVAFVDDDEVVPGNYLREALALLERTDADGAGGPALEPPDARRRTCPKCSLGEVRRTPDSDGRVSVLPGGNMILRAALFESVGPFDPDLSGRGDESEWFERGELDLRYSDDLYVWHYKDASSLHLIRRQFVQGKALPLRYRKLGVSYRPSIRLMLRRIAHAMRHRCLRGWLGAAQDLGALYAAAGQRARRRRVR